jgi:four helix bundle protein
MAGVRNFIDLLSWQKARQWSKAIFEHTLREPFATDRRLVSQINDSSESVMSNIAEGFGRGTQGEFVTFLGYAVGSVNETQSHLCAAYDRKYISRSDYADLFRAGTEIRKLIVGFIVAMVKPGSGVKHMRPTTTWTSEVWETYERLTGKPRPALFVPGSGAKAADYRSPDVLPLEDGPTSPGKADARRGSTDARANRDAGAFS